MPEILINVINKIPQLSGDVRQITADNTDYRIRFVFDDDWSEGEKTVFFVREGGFAYPFAITENDEADVPAVMGVHIRTSLFVGVQQGSVKTSRPCMIPVYHAITDMIDDSAVQPEPTMWEGIVQRIMELEMAKLSPVAADAGMSKPVGVTEDGQLMTAPDVFWAQYGVTKYADIKAAVDAGKLCVLRSNNDTAVLASGKFAEFFDFLGDRYLNTRVLYRLRADDSWTTQSYSIITEHDRTSAITPDSAGRMIPTDKAVYNAILKYAAGGGGGTGAVLVEFTPGESGDSVVSSMTSQGIYDAVVAGKSVVGIAKTGAYIVYVTLSFATPETAMFVSSLPGDSSDHDIGYSVVMVAGSDAHMSSVNIKEMTPAGDLNDGTAGLVPAPAKGEQNHVLFGDAAWKRAYTADQTDALLGKKADKVLVVTATENEDGSITADVNSADIVAHVNGGGESVMKMEDAVLPLIMSEVVSNTAIATYGMTMLAMDDGATPMTVLATVSGTQVALETFVYDPAEHGFIKADKITEAVNYALAQAKESGEFKGDPGEPGQPGDDYVLTEADKTEIAQEAAGLIDTALLSIIGEVSA